MFEFYKLPITERWDKVLEWFITSPNAQPYASTYDLCNYINQMSGHLYTNCIGNLWYDLQPVIEKLIAEGKLHDSGTRLDGNNNDIRVYSASENGRQFILNRGYTAEINRKSAENTRLENLENHQMRHQWYMSVLTLTLAVFAFLSVFLQSLEKFHAVFRIDVWSAFFLYLAGLVSGLIALLIAKEVLSRK